MIRLLVLDDDAEFYDQLVMRLTREDTPRFVCQRVASVQQARHLVATTMVPFDIFLINLRLAGALDGIQVMEELLKMSPTSDAIIKSREFNANTALRAILAGATRFFSIQFSIDELLFTFRSLYEKRRAEEEREWFKILNEVAEATQQSRSVKEVARVVVEGVLRLGFERARLWLLNDTQYILQGIDQAGKDGFENFGELRIPVKQSVYTQDVLNSREPVFFNGLELGDGFLYRQFEERGIKSAVGEWVSIPLWSSNRCLGKLSFDNADKSIKLRPAQREFLRLFGKQVAAVLERAQLQEKEARKKEELTFFNRMMQDLTTLPTDAGYDVDMLLSQIRAHVGRLIDVSDLTIGLLDQETGLLDLRLRVKDNQQQPRVWKKETAGFIWDVVSQNKSLFLPSSGWMGVPLRIRNQVVGALAIESKNQKEKLTENDLRLLTNMANPLAGVIQTALLAERDAKKAKQLTVLNQASEILMNLALEKEELVWHATLTVATASYALRFNRAALFLLEEEGTRLRGKMAIGHFNKQEAERDWQVDKQNGLDLEGYLELLCCGDLSATPLDDQIRDLVIEINADDEHVFANVLRSGKRAIITGPKKKQLLPFAFRKEFDSVVTRRATCAVLPIQGAMGQIIGLLVLDNAFTRKPIRESTLKHLEPLLNQAALLVENRDQRLTRDALLDANMAIMAQASYQPLGQTLTQICKAGQTILGADMVMIYPLKQNGKDHEYDFNHVGQVGRQSAVPLQTMMSQSGTAAYVKRSGLLIVSDIEHHTTRYNQQRLSEHVLMQEEQIKAFIGLPIKDSQTGNVLGMQFFDYRRRHTFTSNEIHLAKLFANLAAVAIQNAYAADQVRQDMQEAQGRGESSQRELKILQRVLEEALGDTDQERLIRALFHAARDLLHTPEMRLILSLREWMKPQTAEEEPCEVRYQYLLNEDGSLHKKMEKQIDHGIIGLTLKTKESQLVNNVNDDLWRNIYYNQYPSYQTQSELDVPIKLGDKVIGVFNAESTELAAFTPAHQATFERLAAVTALALNNLRRREELYSVLKAAKAVTSPLRLQETLKEVIQAARQTAPDLSALTIWYRDPEHKRLILGPNFGVKKPNLIQQDKPNEESIVWQVMHAPEPIWATMAQENSYVTGRFVKDEKIISTAAFPLRANGEKIGAMFFNYRQAHDFTSEEKALFPILAEIVASCVRDAGQLEATRKERDRLDGARKITEAVGAALDLDEIMCEVMSILRDQLFPDTNICISTYDQVERTLQLTPISREFYKIDYAKPGPFFPVSLERGCIACRVATASLSSKQIEVINISNVKNDSTYLPLISQTQSEIGISLMSSKHELLGILVLESPQEHRFDKEDEALLRHVSHKISLAMERAYQSADLQFHTTIAATTSWAAEIAHDIRNEAGRIRNRTYWLLEDGQFTPQERIYINEIEESAQRLAWTGKSADALQTRPVTLLPIDCWIKKMVKSFIADKNKYIELTFDLQCPQIFIQGIESSLRIVLRHLIRNAIEAMQGKKSCHLIIRTKRVDHQKMIEVQVEDSGSGLHESIRHTLFQKPRSTKDHSDRGFGLLFTRYEIQKMGGTIRSIPATVLPGTCFAFTLPIPSDE